MSHRMLELLPEAARTFAVDQAGRLLLSERPGERIRELRDRFGLTQKELAACVDLRRETLSRVEGGHQSPSTDLLRSVVRVFTLAHIAREHVAAREAGDRPVDHSLLSRTANGLRLAPEVADRIIMHALADYGGKRRSILSQLEEER